MTKLILAPVLALAMTAGAIAPAQAKPAYSEPVFTSNGIIAILIGLLLPAVQRAPG